MMNTIRSAQKNKASQFVKIADKSYGWCELEDFQVLLIRERYRSMRTGLTCTFINLDVSDYFNGSIMFPAESYTAFFSKVVKIISENVRFFDPKCVISDSKIAILLVDTPLSNGEAFIKKLALKLTEYFDEQRKVDLLLILKHLTLSAQSLETTLQNGGHSSLAPSFQHPLKDMASNILSEYDQWQPPEFHSERTPRPGTSKTNGKYIADENELLSEPVSSFYQKDRAPHLGYFFLKRLIDIVGALFGMAIFLPAAITIALVIKLTSSGPVLFRQQRVGYQGKLFTFLKFRSMYVNNNNDIHKEYIAKLIEGNTHDINNGSDHSPIFKLKNDPRITPIGRILRKTSLDELPQFMNVLVGSMSLVGPRPPIPYEVDMYQQWHLSRVMEAKPGITGLWQVYGRNKTTFDEMVRIDLQYLKKRSVWLDMKLIIKTALLIFNPKSGL